MLIIIWNGIGRDIKGGMPIRTLCSNSVSNDGNLELGQGWW